VWAAVVASSGTWRRLRRRAVVHDNRIASSLPTGAPSQRHFRASGPRLVAAGSSACRSAAPLDIGPYCARANRVPHTSTPAATLSDAPILASPLLTAMLLYLQEIQTELAGLGVT